MRILNQIVCAIKGHDWYSEPHIFTPYPFFVCRRCGKIAKPIK